MPAQMYNRSRKPLAASGGYRRRSKCCSPAKKGLTSPLVRGGGETHGGQSHVWEGEEHPSACFDSI